MVPAAVAAVAGALPAVQLGSWPRAMFGRRPQERGGRPPLHSAPQGQVRLEQMTAEFEAA